MKQSLLLTMVLFTVLISSAQSKNHRIVYDLNSADTAAQSAVLRQFNNILKAAPDAQLELVCHGKAIMMLVKEKSFFEEKIKEVAPKGSVRFTVCANSMRRLNIDKSQLLPIAEVVPVAILELSSKQMEGWSYIKAGE